MMETGLDAGRAVKVPGPRGEGEDEGWREQAARRVAQPTRTDLQDVLVRQGGGLM